jgi:hypothetical protein
MYTPLDYILYLIALPFTLTLFILFSYLLVPKKLNIINAYKKTIENKDYYLTLKIFSLVIIASMPIDIMTNGFKLLDPLSYADINGIGRYVRGVSTYCWALIPIAYFIGNKTLRFLFITLAILFSIVIIDRNRLLLCFYALFFCAIINQKIITKNLSKKTKKNYWVIVLFLLIFAILGQFRSGDAFIVESSGNTFIEGKFPLKPYFFYIPDLFQQIILYIITPLFNFMTILNNGFINTEFLEGQLSPFSRDDYELYPYSPILIARFNVGTEYFPWLLYGGIGYVLLAIVGMLICFFIAAALLKKYPNIFTLLIFIRLSYLILLSVFAPQFYLLSNIIFLLLIFSIWFIAYHFNKN